MVSGKVERFGKVASLRLRIGSSGTRFLVGSYEKFAKRQLRDA